MKISKEKVKFVALFCLLDFIAYIAFHFLVEASSGRPLQWALLDALVLLGVRFWYLQPLFQVPFMIASLAAFPRNDVALVAAILLSGIVSLSFLFGLKGAYLAIEMLTYELFEFNPAVLVALSAITTCIVFRAVPGMREIRNAYS